MLHKPQQRFVHKISNNDSAKQGKINKPNLQANEHLSARSNNMISQKFKSNFFFFDVFISQVSMNIHKFFFIFIVLDVTVAFCVNILVNELKWIR